MKITKGRIYLLSLILFFIFILAACIRVDRPEDESLKKHIKSTEQKEEIVFPRITKTINGVDYLLSRKPAGVYGGDVVVSTIGEGPKTFNPWNSKDNTSSAASEIMFDSLVTTDAYNGEVIPKLAKSVKTLPDKKTYIIELRKGLKWSDGKEITADDVVYTWNTIIFGGYGNTSTRDAMYIDGELPAVSKIDKYTVKFVTPKPFSPFLRQIAVPIAPEHVLKKVTDKGKREFESFWSSNVNPSELVTSGAFRLKEYVPAQRIVYERNPDYYIIDEKGQKLPYIDKYIMLIVGDLNNELLKFKSKELDFVGLRGTNVSIFKENEARSDYKIFNLGPNSGTLYLGFNLNDRKNSAGKYYVNPVKQKWFNDLNFRKAVDYAIDRENIVFNIASGVGAPLFTPEPLSSIYLNEQVAKGHLRDMEYAAELLEQSGYKKGRDGKLRDKNGNKVEFDLYTNAGNTERESIGVMIKQDLEDLGMSVNFKPVEFNTLVNKLTNTKDWDMVILGFTGSPLEPYGGKNVWYSNGTLHMFNMRTEGEKAVLLPWEKRLDEIFDAAALELDFAKRKKLYEEYQQLIYEEKPLIYLYSPLMIYAVRNKFGNLHPTEIGGVMHNIEEIYIKK